MKYRVFIEQDEDGVFVAEVPALPGCISQGNTRKEALRNIQEAILSCDKYHIPIDASLSQIIMRWQKERCVPSFAMQV